jgi:hypothetical protein
MLHALHHKEPDRVPTGENDIHYVLAEQLLGHTTLYNSRWRERQALWDGRRAEIVHDYGTTLVDLARTLEWDYVRVPTMPVDKVYRRPVMTGGQVSQPQCHSCATASVSGTCSSRGKKEIPRLRRIIISGSGFEDFAN